MRVLPVPCLFDNYAYLVVGDTSSEALILDPSESAPVRRAADEHGLHLIAVLCTHHHSDHIGGITGLLEQQPDLQVYAHQSDKKRVAGLTNTVEHEQVVKVGSLTAKALHVPGHTRGALTWLIEDAAFTGDTLFVAGCGRLFEGSAAQMYASLHDVLGKLDPQTKVYCGHEYTIDNLRFARHVDPDNPAVAGKLKASLELRANNVATVPSTMAEELQTNPFLRSDKPALVQYATREGAGPADPLSVFALLREHKNRFKT